MEIKVLQGVNLENQFTTIKITTDSTPKTDLIDMVKAFHPIFVIDYSTNGNTISIQSKLPHLWKEAAVAINNHSTGEWTFEKAKDYILDYVITNQISSMSTIPVLHGAHNLGFETCQLLFVEGIYTDPLKASKKSILNRYYRVGVGRQSAATVSVSSSGDSKMAKEIQRDKWMTNTMIDRLQLPNAPWEVIESEDKLREIFDNYAKPVVIKPVGLVGGSGVTTNIFDIDHAIRAYKYAKVKTDEKVRSAWQLKIMIQQQVPGEDYRLLVVNGVLEIATKRIPAFVIGNGKSTIRELIEETNKDPRRDVSNPAHVLKPIKFDQMLDEYIEEQGKTLDYIPTLDEKLNVRKVASMSQGGVTEDFTDKVHPQIKYVAESMSRTVHAHVVGIDVICADISKPLTIENGSFIEMNTMPEAYLNMFPTIGKQYPEVGEKIVSGLLDGIEPTKKVVVIGGDKSDINNTLKAQGFNLNEEIVGLYSEGSIFINDQTMSSGVPTWKAIEALKVNALPTTIVLHYANIEEIKEFGFGFDSIDLLVDYADTKVLESQVVKKVVRR